MEVISGWDAGMPRAGGASRSYDVGARNREVRCFQLEIDSRREHAPLASGQQIEPHSLACLRAPNLGQSYRWAGRHCRSWDLGTGAPLANDVPNTNRLCGRPGRARVSPKFAGWGAVSRAPPGGSERIWQVIEHERVPSMLMVVALPRRPAYGISKCCGLVVWCKLVGPTQSLLSSD